MPTEKNLPGRPETTCLSVNDINPKRYKQPGEVEHSICILETAQKRGIKMMRTNLKTLRERLEDEKV